MKPYFALLAALLLQISTFYANPKTVIEISAENGICMACPVPTGLTVSGQTGTEASLSWAAVSGATHYSINVQNGTGNPNFFNVNGTSTTTTFVIPGLLPNMNYKFKVRAHCDNGDKSNWSAYSNFNSSSSGGGPCTVPANLAATSPAAGEANLTWGAVAGAISYTVQVQNGTGNPNVFNQLFTATTNSQTVTGLLAGFNYKFKVRSNCYGGGHTGWSAWKTFNTLPGASGTCTVPTGLLGTGTAPGEATLTWNTVGAAMAYAVEVQNASGNPNVFLLNDTSDVNSLIVSGLMPGLAYKFKVRSLCIGGGNTNWSGWKTFVTPSVASNPSADDRLEKVFGVQISPNPVRNLAIIEISGLENQKTEMKLMDLTGRVLKSETIVPDSDEFQTEINLSNLPNGLYLLKTQSGHKFSTQKIFLDKV